MPAFNTNQWAILLLVLVLGWLLGLLSRSGGSKWRRVYERERSDHIASRNTHEAGLAAANARIAELERMAPAPAPAPAPVGDRLAGGVPATDQPDDLSLIRGIGTGDIARLNENGVHRYHDLSRMDAAEEAVLEQRMGVEPGRIARGRWREQADLLATNRHADHRRMFP